MALAGKTQYVQKQLVSPSQVDRIYNNMKTNMKTANCPSEDGEMRMSYERKGEIQTAELGLVWYPDS